MTKTRSKTRPARLAKDRQKTGKTGKRLARPARPTRLARPGRLARPWSLYNFKKKNTPQAQAVAAAERLWCGRLACPLPLVNLPSTKSLLISTDFRHFSDMKVNISKGNPNIHSPIHD